MITTTIFIIAPGGFMPALMILVAGMHATARTATIERLRPAEPPASPPSSSH
jgi:hypothetical protein